MRGGKREGAGAPSGPRLKPEEKKRNFTTKLSPDLLGWLDKMKADGRSKAGVVEYALRHLKEHDHSWISMDDEELGELYDGALTEMEERGLL